MQKRLFRAFMLMSLLPVTLLLLLLWPLSGRYLDMLDSEGLNSSLEGSLELARVLIDTKLAEMNGRMDAGDVPAAARLEVDAAGGLSPIETGIAAALESRISPTGDVAQRVELPDRDWLVVARGEGDERRFLAQGLDPELTAVLRQVALGGSMLRQMRLFYNNMLRIGTLVLLVVLGLAITAAAAFFASRLSKQISRPLASLAEGTRRVAAGHLDHRVDVKAPDEIGELVGAFNDMTVELVTSKEELVRAERVAAWQGVARRLAHEIKNPLTPITLAMHRIGKRSDDPAITDAVETVLEEAGNLKRLADEFSLYARLPEPRREPADLGEIARAVCELYAEPSPVDVRLELSNAGRIEGDPGLLRQVVANLVKNAIAAMGASGTLTLTLAAIDDTVSLEVRDDGPGLPEPVEQVFAPYFTTRASGTGLGLAISRKIVEDHGGRLGAANRPEGGARFTLELPTPLEDADD